MTPFTLHVWSNGQALLSGDPSVMSEKMVEMLRAEFGQRSVTLSDAKRLIIFGYKVEVVDHPGPLIISFGEETPDDSVNGTQRPPWVKPPSTCPNCQKNVDC